MAANPGQREGNPRPVVSILLTGRVALRANGLEVDERGLPGRQCRLVFAYLATEQRPVPRGELAEALWGDSPPPTWQKALSVIVSKLRDVLDDCGVDGSRALTSAFGCYRLELPQLTSVDVVEARRAVEHPASSAEELARAAEIAARPFLSGDDGDWIDARRRELADLRVRALERLADANLASGEHEQSARVAEQVVELEPYRESAYRRLMQAQMAAGNRADALWVYDRCRRTLADELGAYPSPETEAVYRELLRTPEPPERHGPARPEAPPRRRGRRPIPIATAILLLLGAAAALAALTRDVEKVDVTAGPRAIAARSCGNVESRTDEPELLIASDLPLQGPQRQVTRTMVDAMRLVLRHHQFQAGPYTLGFQSCDDATAASGGFDLARCQANARAYTATPQLAGVIGTFNSPCVMAELEIANRAPNGPLAFVSPANTYPGLTIGGPGAGPGEPEKFAPSGIRSFFRVVASDDLQAAAAAMLAREISARSVYVLDDGEGYGQLVAHAFRRAAERLNLRIAGAATWDPDSASYTRLARTVRRSNPDAVFLGGDLPANGAALVRDLRARLPQSAAVIAPDGFLPIPDLLDAAPRAAIGLYVSIAGLSTSALNPAGQTFLRELAVNRQGADPAASYVPEAAQAAEVLLAAISNSDGTRRSVIERLKATKVENGILGSFFFDRNGDITPAPVTIYRVTGRPSDRSAPDFKGTTVDRVVHVPVTIVR
jgi:branched-chain amino acid transport system substrate-binding protein